jgi:hypothetical protein
LAEDSMASLRKSTKRAPCSVAVFLGMRGQPPESFLIRGKAVRGKFDGRAFGIAEQLAN